MKENTIQHRRLMTATIFTFIFMSGYALTYTMLGTLLPGIIQHYSLSISQASYINISLELGGTSAMVLALFLLDRLNKGKTLLILALFFGLIALYTGSAPPFALMLISRFFMGLVGSVLDNLCATYISDLYGEHRARYVSLLHTFFAIASMIAPKFAALCYQVGGWSLAYLVCGGAITIAAVLAVVILRVMGFPQNSMDDQKQEKTKIPYREMLQSRNMRWLCLASFLFAGYSYVAMWLSTYLDGQNSSIYTVGFCSTIMTAYYVGSVVSRVGLAAISEKISSAVYLKWASLLSGILLVALLLIQQPVAWLVGSFLYGVIGGAMYTGRFVLSCQEFPQFSATASSLTGICSFGGNMAFSAIMGMVADAGFYTQGMLVIAVLLVTGFFIFEFGYRSKQS
ncbi:MAG: MFS transporter [Oscillospiraceae bacterium]|jgi:fucose permease|nr:MFS transporter [Oscillospiraceae bacterium]